MPCLEIRNCYGGPRLDSCTAPKIDHKQFFSSATSCHVRSCSVRTLHLDLLDKETAREHRSRRLDLKLNRPLPEDNFLQHKLKLEGDPRGLRRRVWVQLHKVKTDSENEDPGVRATWLHGAADDRRSLNFSPLRKHLVVYRVRTNR